MKKLFQCLLLSLSAFVLYAQNVEVAPAFTPAFFSADKEITIEYDVTGTSLASLDKAYLWAWLPSLGALNAPSNINPASSNTGATDIAQFTKVQESGKTLFRINLTLTTFFGKTKEEIKEIGLLLKGNDWANGQTADAQVTVSDGFALQVTSPSTPYSFYQEGDEIMIIGSTSQAANITITIDEAIVLNEENTTVVNFTHDVIADGAVHLINVSASTTEETIVYTHSYTLQPETTTEAVPAGLVDGINYHDGDDTKVSLVLTAPGKENVFVIGEMNGWSLDQDFLMKKDGDRFWVAIDNLIPGKEYIFQYLIDGELKIADPYAEKISSPFDDAEIISLGLDPTLKPFPFASTSEAAAYLQTAQQPYVWEVEDFARPDDEDLIIYEMLIRDFTDTRTYAAAIERFDYLQELGINAIELMPVMEFEGNNSWGYNPAFMTAVDKYYGTKNDLKKFIDEAHKRGIAIILDIALNHTFGRNPLARMYNDGLYGKPTLDNPWLNREATHDFNVGYDFNHESELTQNYVDRVVSYWIDEFNIDGYRFDLSKGFTQRVTIGNISAWNRLDQSRVDLLTRMVDKIWENDPSFYVILEHLADNEEEKVLANLGMMVWGKMTDKYDDLAAGNVTSIGRLYHEWRGFDDPHIVGYMESHDEERLMWTLENRRSSFSLSQRLERMKLNAAFFLTVPGPKMMWQFGEFGYDEELNDSRLAIKPTRWEYLENTDRAKLKDVYQALINLRTKTDYISVDNFDWEPNGAIKWINTNHPEVQISIFGNFSTSTMTGSPHFQAAGTWHDYLSGEEIVVTDKDAAITLAPGEFHIYTSQPIENYIEGDPSPIILSSEKEATDRYTVYPNPADHKISILGDQGMKVVEIFDGRGNAITTVNLGIGERDIDIVGIAPGIYYVHILNGTQKQIEKIIIR